MDYNISKYKIIKYICKNIEVTFNTDINIKDYECPICNKKIGIKTGCKSYYKKYLCKE